MILPIVSELLGVVGHHPAVEDAVDAARRGVPESRIGGLADAVKALVAAHVAATLQRPVVVVTSSNERADMLGEAAGYFLQSLGRRLPEATQVLPALDVTPWDLRAPHAEIAEERAATLWRMATGEAAVVIAPVAAALGRFGTASEYRELARTVVDDEELPLETLVEFLRRAGYQREQMVAMPGQFALRGGIVDVFPPEGAYPVRIELLGDTVESLRRFDPETQRSVQPVERVTLLPLVERGEEKNEDTENQDYRRGHGENGGRREEQRGANLFQLLHEPVILVDEAEDVAEAATETRARLGRAYERRGAGTPEAGVGAFALGEEEWAAAIGAHQRVVLERLTMEVQGSVCGAVLCQATRRFHGNLPAFLEETRGRLTAREQILLSSATAGETERLAEILRDAELPFRIGEVGDAPSASLAADDVPLRGMGDLPAITLIRAPVADGVALPELRLAIYGTADLFDTQTAGERPRARGPARSMAAVFASDFSELEPGNHVVHVDHGIGRFEGLRRMEASDGAREFMQLTYADEARLYVPLERMDLVQKYNALGGAAPALDRLGGTAWTQRKARVKKSVAEMAEKLLRLYAERKVAKGFRFSADSPWQKEFEDAFEFEETKDQVRAIEEVKRDMEGEQPMDRLLCGDVGYGKTEVALRAAFKAVSDSRQVAVLAPTTVLAFQHWETFRRRMAAFPMRIEMLSRFRTKAEQRGVLGELEAGKVDVVIGTHRLLSKDVKFHDLGLLVVDEEQRFGVAAKERVKELRREVDVLTLSATPIPRTLHMSLAGLRDMSLIETPPKDRLAIQTVVAPFSEGMVGRAIEEELARGGQVFFVHNRVGSIASIARLVHRLAPRARVLVGHGQMGEKELERVMMQFVRREADVLVATTIIENGLDISNCNTLIVNRADRMGLAELYQLRGRVGRSNVRAYAYLLVPPDVPLSGEARQRLAALKEFSDLGAGFRIAALDLEMRGAGNLLGREQHGHVGAVGFEMYCQMLERAVGEQKGEAVAPERRATIQLGLDIRIPETYIPEEALRLRTYKRIAAVTTEEQREDMLGELEDRFGPPPPAVENLLEYAVLKSLAERTQVEAIERKGNRVGVRFVENASLPPERLVEIVRARKDLRLEPGGILWLDTKQDGTSALHALKTVLRHLEGSR
ncbi:MAG TPA: transcription-repair coupling factor [Candidatus Solibacter sp.]|nr:transcription-repair coupling factor [Candidatus Solibacter sp.]